jgi:hypothetical protein
MNDCHTPRDPSRGQPATEVTTHGQESLAGERLAAG